MVDKLFHGERYFNHMKMEKPNVSGMREEKTAKETVRPEALHIWEPPQEISLEEIIRMSKDVLAMPDIMTKTREDIFRMRVFEMDWDIGAMVYEPDDPSKIPTGPDGKKVGFFLLHGGTGDYKSLDPVARMITGKFGIKVANMTFPGRLYLLDPSRDWPADTLNPDGSVRTPLWTKETRITQDQYEIIEDTSNRKKYGTFFSLMAKEGTEFYYRMAAWPVAFEEAMKETCHRHFPEDRYSVYAHGHSTGGPFIMILSQRVSNVTGILGYGSVPFGYIFSEVTGKKWDFPFNYLRLRTWRDTARYAEEEFASKKHSFPVMMEVVLDRWEKEKKRANFKAEDFVHKNNTHSLAEAARVTATRLKMGPKDMEDLIKKYVGYCRELSGPGVKPVPPVLSVHGIGDDTVTYNDCKKALPLFSAMNPQPKVRCVLLGAGVHRWAYTDDDLPCGVIPTVTKLWYEAIMAGCF